MSNAIPNFTFRGRPVNPSDVPQLSLESQNLLKALYPVLSSDPLNSVAMSVTGASQSTNTLYSLYNSERPRYLYTGDIYVERIETYETNLAQAPLKDRVVVLNFGLKNLEEAGGLCPKIAAGFHIALTIVFVACYIFLIYPVMPVLGILYLPVAGITIWMASELLDIEPRTLAHLERVIKAIQDTLDRYGSTEVEEFYQRHSPPLLQHINDKLVTLNIELTHITLPSAREEFRKAIASYEKAKEELEAIIAVYQANPLHPESLA